MFSNHTTVFIFQKYTGFNLMATPINILINEESLIEYFDKVSLKFSEGTFCNSIDISIKDQRLWDIFDPIENFGMLKLRVSIGTVDYEFLTEERNATVTESGIGFSVWGRSAQALLDRPYSQTIIDTEENIHPWQTGDCYVSDIITYVMEYCCPEFVRNAVPIHWMVEDFIVYKDSFSTSNNSPIEIISSLADIIGAELIANADGSLTIQEYSVSEGIAVQEYNDLDDITGLSDDIVYPVGYNSVTVEGYSDAGTDSAYLSTKIIEDGLDSWIYNVNRTVRVYYYHPDNYEIMSSCIDGTSQFNIKGTETITEYVLITFGEGSTSLPDLTGSTQIKGDPDVPFEYREVTYDTAYADFIVSSQVQSTDDPVYGLVGFYFSDYSNVTTIEFDLTAESERNIIQLELDDATTDYTLYFRIYGTYLGYTKRLFDTMYQEPEILSSTITYFGIEYPDPSSLPEVLEETTDTITFTNGTGTLSRPFHSVIDPETLPVNEQNTIQWHTPGESNLIFEVGSLDVRQSVIDSDFPITMATVVYNTNYVRGKTPIPSSFTGSSFSVYLEKNSTVDIFGNEVKGEILSVSKSIGEKVSLWLYVKDFIDNLVLFGVSVWIDDLPVGQTGLEGGIYIPSISVGTHTIRMSQYGFLGSEEDDLINSQFTVESQQV